MDRRKFIRTAASGLFTVPTFARAQPTGKRRRLGWLANWAPPEPAEFREYTQHLRAFRWIEGQNLLIEQRYTSGNTDLLPALAHELVSLNVDILVAEGTVVALAAKQATTTIPIVVARSADPVRAGLVVSRARPGRNVTGTSLISPTLDGKRFQILHELIPAAKRVGMLIVPANPVDRAAHTDPDAVRALAALGMQPIFIEVTQASELEGAVAEAARRGSQALRVSAEPLLGQNFDQLIHAARKYSLPVIADNAGFLENGAIASYGPDVDELNRQLVFCIDQILRGTRPADLPIQQPGKFELGIKLRVAKSLGITVPQSLLQRADIVIQ